MANEVPLKASPTQTIVVWADATDYAPTGTGDPTRTAQLDLTSLANAAARQGAKQDLGATWGQQYVLELQFEFDVVPTAGTLVSVYLGWSISSTAGDFNPGNLSGADAAYTGYNSNISDSVKQLSGPFNLVCADDGAAPSIQMAQIGIVTPQRRYVSPVVFNNSGEAGEGDAVEMYLSMFPLVPEIQ